MDLEVWACQTYPEAAAEQRDGEWWIALYGEPRRTLPRGVRDTQEHAWAAHDREREETVGRAEGTLGYPRSKGGSEHELSVADRDLDTPLRLDLTLHQVVDDLSDAVTQADPEAAAKALAAHVRRYSTPALCQHGLPIYHDVQGGPLRISEQRPGGPQCVATGPTDSDVNWLRVNHVASMMTTLDAVDQTHRWLVGQRKPIRRRLFENLTAWPVVDDWLRRLALKQFESDGLATLSQARARQVVVATIDNAMRFSASRVGFRWHPNKRPELTFVADSAIGLYLADVVGLLGSDDVDDRPSYDCQHCGQTFLTRRRLAESEGRYCPTKPECQRARRRENIRRLRARNRED